MNVCHCSGLLVLIICWPEVILIVYTVAMTGLAGGGGPIMGDLWALKGLFDEG